MLYREWIKTLPQLTGCEYNVRLYDSRDSLPDFVVWVDKVNRHSLLAAQIIGWLENNCPNAWWDVSPTMSNDFTLFGFNNIQAASEFKLTYGNGYDPRNQ